MSRFRLSQSRVSSFMVIGMTLALLGCHAKQEQQWVGYVEGEYIYISPTLAGKIDNLAVQVGQQVDSQALLFELDHHLEQATQQEAQSRAKAAAAQAQNANKGKRVEELAITQAQLANAKAQNQLAQSELQRIEKLVAQGFISKAKLDEARTQVVLSQARIAELEAAYKAGKLPAREDERAAVQALAQANAQVLDQAVWRRSQKTQVAPVAGLVAEVFHRKGEVVNAGQPVLSLLPPNQIKLRFYVPENQLSQIRLGQSVDVNCDGCKTVTAKIVHIAAQAEYTPPVIYSNSQRAKLVFLVEAKPDWAQGFPDFLHPGLPIDVKPAEKKRE